MNGPEQRPIATVDTVILTLEDQQLKVLLHQRPQPPFAGCFALPGGYIRPEEDDNAEAAARRVFAQKAGTPSFYLEQLATYSGQHRDPRGWSLSVVYLALVPRHALQLRQEEGLVQLFALEALPELAFDHADIIADARQRVRGKSAYSTLPATLIGETFTMSTLLRTYEALLGEKLDASSFRRKVREMNLLEDTGLTSQDNSRRPARLYRLRGAVGAIERSLAGPGQQDSRHVSDGL